MRVNVYSQELTPEVHQIEREFNTGVTYHAAQLIMHSSERLHHPRWMMTAPPSHSGCRNLTRAGKR